MFAWPRQPLLLLGCSTWLGGIAGWLLYGQQVQAWVLPGWVVLAICLAAAPRRWVIVAALVAAGLVAGSASVLGHLAATRPAAVQGWAQEGAELVAVVRVHAASVRTSTDIGSQPTSRVVATAVGFTAGSHRLDAATPIVLLAGTDVLDSPLRGSLLRVEGRLLPHARLAEPGMAMSVDRAASLQPPHGWSNVVAAARAGMWTALSGVDGDAASLVAGLAIGDDSRSSEQLASAMRASGLSHLLAVSGGNVAIVTGLVLAASALLGAPLSVRLVAALIAILGYAAFVGPEPSVLRAAVMGSVALVGVLRGSKGGGFPLLGAAMVSLIVFRPGLALSWGFALSVAATAGILGAAPVLDRRLSDRWGGARRPLLAALSVTLAAQAATAPLLAAMTGTLSLVAVPANLLAAPLVAPITVLGLLIAVLSVPLPAPARWLAHLAEPCGLALAWIAHWGAALPAGSLRVPPGPLGAVVVAAALAGAAVVWRSRGPRATAVLLAVLLLVAALLGRVPAPPRDWVAAACDVGQGDAFLVRSGAASAVLIDTGPDSAALMKCIDRMGVRQIDLLLLTHFDTDHVAATPAVLRRFRPPMLVSPLDLPAANAAAVRRSAARADVPVATARAGMRLAVGTASLSVVWPRRIIAEGSVSNNAAVATAVDAGGLRMLFTGDLEPRGQSALMTSHPAHSFDVATIPHHGSANQHPEFLRWTGAGATWVSAGRNNRFGHPRPEALALAAAASATTGRTDLAGTLVLVRRQGGPQLLPLAGS